MKILRPYNELGQADFGWLQSHHTFSFGQYYDPAHMGFGPLRVINNDRVAGGAGFPMHGHQNMEIISYVLKGGLAHRDSLGTEAVIPAGNLQLMSAGAGIEHSEYNASKTDQVHFLQIWIKPSVLSTKPSYQELTLNPTDLANKLHPVVTPDGAGDSLQIKQDATLSIGRFTAGSTITIPETGPNKAWVQVASGHATGADITLGAGDGLGLTQEKALSLRADEDTEILVFSMH